MIFIILILCILLFAIFLLSSMKRSYKEPFSVFPTQTGSKSSRTEAEIQKEIDTINTQISEWETIENTAVTTLNNTDNITNIDDLYTQINDDINEKCPWKGVASSSIEKSKAYKCLINEPVGNTISRDHPKTELCTGKTIDNRLLNGLGDPCDFTSRETSRTYDLKYISDDNKFCIGHFGGKSKCEPNCSPTCYSSGQTCST